LLAYSGGDITSSSRPRETSDEHIAEAVCRVLAIEVSPAEVDTTTRLAY